MSWENFCGVFLCAGCKQPRTREHDGALVCEDCHQRHPLLGGSVQVEAKAGTLSSDWRSKQDDSVQRYKEESYNQDTTIPRLFGGFIALGLPRHATVLDIGCGISSERPAYAAELSDIEYIGLEPLGEPIRREYPCLAGAVA
jgi:hypothetical protein